ncbi:outer membrane beta-barrel protein [Hydrocarboniphaga sp.]|uniref:outer membrane beta-barrel protein n=1 Tax=Hydrocarboniphaga sp. TaxID=2033016 RepID=UPI003D10E924
MNYRALLLCIGFVGLLGNSLQAQATGSLRAAIGGGGFDLDDDEAALDAEADLNSADFRATFQVDNHVFLRGEYTHNWADQIKIDHVEYDTDIDLNTLRLGVGYGGDVGSIRMYGVAEYVKLDFNIEDEGDDGNGWGLTFGIGNQLQAQWIWNAELSLLDVEGTTGAALDASVGYRFTPMFAGLVGLQSYAFEDDGSEVSFGNAYIGLQLMF